jgi:hypothetical protein
MGITERINDLLGAYCSGGYGGGTIGQANYNFLKSEFGGQSWLWFGSQYRLGDVVRFSAPVDDSKEFARFIDLLGGLEDYPLLDEETHGEILWNLEQEEWDSLVSEHNLEWQYVNEIRQDGEYYFEDVDGMGTLYGLRPNFDVEDFVAQVRELQQTWLTHYYSQMAHFPEVCAYCKESSLEVA